MPTQPVDETVISRPLASPVVAKTDGAERMAVIARSGSPVVIRQLLTPPAQSGGSSGIPLVSFQWGNASPRSIYMVPSGKTLLTVGLVIQIPFDGAGASIAIQDANSTTLMGISENSPYTVAEYETNPGLTYSSPTDIRLIIQPGSGASQGSGVVFFELSG